MKKIVLSLSGGLDSTTLLAFLLDLGYEVFPFQFIYGSKHNQQEQLAVERIQKHYSINVPVLDLSNVFSQISSNLLNSGGAVPEGHYNHESMRLTVVPGRNSIFISILTGIAESIEAECVAIGVHQGDHHIYPDCRAKYIDAMGIAMLKASDGKVHLIAPFLFLDKSQIVSKGIDLKVPYDITRTCYTNNVLACGKCGSCTERLEAFQINNIVDPLPYAHQVNEE